MLAIGLMVRSPPPLPESQQNQAIPHLGTEKIPKQYHSFRKYRFKSLHRLTVVVAQSMPIFHRGCDIGVTAMTLRDYRTSKTEQDAQGGMPKCVEAATPRFPANPQFVHNGLENRLDHFVAGVRAASPVHEDKFVVVGEKMCSEFLYDDRWNGEGVLAFCCLHGLNLPVPSGLLDGDGPSFQIDVTTPEAENLT